MFTAVPASPPNSLAKTRKPGTHSYHCLRIFNTFAKTIHSFRLETAWYKSKLVRGISGWLSGLAPAFGPGGRSWSPGIESCVGSLHGACFSLCLCLCLSLSIMKK
ncbi:hypothetical protein VULLAG_LOCUS16960 [Vulpes lagopus]